MRDLLMFAIVFGSLPFILKRPTIGVLMFTWFSLMNPHRLTYGAAYSFPFAALIAAVTFGGILFSKERKRMPLSPVIIILGLFICWSTFTSFFALEAEQAWIEWNRVMKTFLMAMIAMYIINSDKDVKAFACVVALSLGFYGLKGGVFTLLSGGVNRVFGPEESYIADNNHLALALLVSLPLIWWMYIHSTKKWMAICLAILVFLTGLSVVGTYSRGALLGGGAMLAFLCLKSRYKLRTGVALIIVLPLILTMMPEQWFERMGSIGEYKEDDSAMGRINAWMFAINVATDKFIGGGFDVFTPRIFLIYAPEPLRFHVAHSIYFQVLGEHGFIGLGLFLALMVFAWRIGARVINICRKEKELKWASDLAAMCQVSIIGYAVGGAFLSLAYYDLYYNIIALLVGIEKLVNSRLRHTSEASKSSNFQLRCLYPEHVIKSEK